MDAREYTVVDKRDGSVLGKFSSMAKAKKFIVEKRSEGCSPAIRTSGAPRKERTAVGPKPGAPGPKAGAAPKATKSEPSTQSVKKGFEMVMLRKDTGIMSALMDRMDRNALLDIINEPRKEIQGSSSKYRERPETFTTRHVVEPILRWLGYDRLAYQPGVSSSSKTADIGLILDDGWMVLVEVKPLGAKLKDNKKQLEGYIKVLERKYDKLRKDVAILTDGIEWHMWSGGRWRDLSIVDLYRWAYDKLSGRGVELPEMTMRKFWTAFCSDNVTNSARCVADRKEWQLKEGGKYVDYKDLKDDPPTERKEEKRRTYRPIISANIKHREREPGALGRREGVSTGGHVGHAVLDGVVHECQGVLDIYIHGSAAAGVILPSIIHRRPDLHGTGQRAVLQVTRRRFDIDGFGAFRDDE